MKVLVHFQPSQLNDDFEGARLRKTIKGSLEVNGIIHTNTLMDDFDVAHFVYIEDENVVSELAERNIPFVVSALYCEDDPSASYLEYKNKDGSRSITLKPKAIKFLEKANLILVPNNSAKQILVEAGLTNRIEVCPPGVNFARFDFSRDDEKELFYRYFACERDKKIVVAIGDTSLDGLNVIVSASKVVEDVNFYYLVKHEKGKRQSWKNKRTIKKLPRNVVYSDMVPDDIYRSILINANVYLHPGYKPAGLISVFEGMAAKCQLIMRKQEMIDEVAIDRETAYVASYSETLVGIIKDYFEGKLKPTIDKAYKQVSKHDFKIFGEKLIDYYKELIGE